MIDMQLLAGVLLAVAVLVGAAVALSVVIWAAASVTKPGHSGIKRGGFGVEDIRAMRCEHPRCPWGGRVGGRSILLGSCLMVGSSFVSVFAWAHEHAS